MRLAKPITFLAQVQIFQVQERMAGASSNGLWLKTLTVTRASNEDLFIREGKHIRRSHISQQPKNDKNYDNKLYLHQKMPHIPLLWM